jgi:serine/threonine-protein kinase
MGVLTKHMFATPEPIEHVVPDPSHLGAFAPIVMRCLAKNPQDRFTNMAEVAAAIEFAVNELSREAPPGASPQEALPSGRPRHDSMSREGDHAAAPAKRALLVPLLVGLGAIVAVAVGAVVWIGTRSAPSDLPQGSASPAGAAPSAVAASSALAAPSGEVKAPPPAAPPTSSAAETAAPSAAAGTPSAVIKPVPMQPRGKPVPPRPAPTRSGKGKPSGGDVIDPWAR